jgi:hypothetical protein
MTGMEQHNTISEQELLTTLSQLCPVAIVITPHTHVDGSRLYAWRAGESAGTHPSLLGAVRAALETAMFSLAYTPVSPETQLNKTDFPPTWA